MNFLKGLALGLLSFFLVLSLSIFSIAFLLNQTILNPGFIASEINKLDIPLLAEEFLSEQIPEEELVVEVLSDTVTDLEPWIQQQVTDGVYSSYDYLMGRSQTLSVVIPLEPVKESLKDNLGETILQSLPPELAGASPAQIELYLNELYDEIDELLPATFELNEDSMSAELSAQLELARKYIGYFQVGYNFLLGFMLLLIVGIVLIDRQVRSTTRKLGTIFLPEGVLMLVGFFVAKYFTGRQLAQLDVPPYLEEWLPQLVSDFVAPLLMLSIGLIIGGVVLLTVSYVYKRQTSS
ncbi:MAG: hypothetical protein E3J66_02145 [Dehalococcoidia bacterium]|nr:MAG: hypothetical protein E3J66_02145 [Dehalococcoidia bacterium]